MVLLRQSVQGRDVETAEMAGQLAALQSQNKELSSLLKTKEVETETANAFVASLKAGHSCVSNAIPIDGLCCWAAAC